MIDSIKRISLDIHSSMSKEIVNANRGDTGRKIYISLVDGGIPYTIAEDCYAVFTATKADGTILYNHCDIEDNVIVYEFTDQTASTVGRVNCEIKLYGTDDALITSPGFKILVYGTVYDENEKLGSTDEATALTHLVSEATSAISAANEAAANAAAVADEIQTARENGAFDGEDGLTPVKGEDYFTEADKQEIAKQAASLVGAVKTVNGVAPDENGNVAIEGGFGESGEDGISCTHEWNGTVLTITSASGTSSADLKGEKGDTGAQGIQGVKGDTGETGAAGKDGEDGYTPVKGTDYFTEADKQEIAEQAASLVELPETAMQPLTFTGAVNATYDGSKAVNVQIPSGGGTLPEYDGTLLCEAVLPAGSEVGTSIPLGITVADLDEYSELYFKWSGASNTGLQNVYIMPRGANMTSGALMRSSHASVAALIVREFENPNIVTVYYGSGNPSTIYDPISKFAYFGNESQASLLYRTAARLDWSNINRVNELVINNSYTVPTVDYTLKIYGIKRICTDEIL